MTTGRRQTRSAFTLLELVLVMAVIVMIVAISSPNIIRAFKRHTLKNSGDLVRAEWAKARTQAMTSGRVQIFRCSMGGGQYRTDTWVSASDAFGVGGSTAPTPTGQDATANQFHQLPDGIAFYAAETAAESRDLATDAEVAGASGDMYERRVYFYPDGTCSAAQIVLQNDRDQYVVVELRSLTGVSRVSEVMSRDQIAQP